MKDNDNVQELDSNSAIEIFDRDCVITLLDDEDKPIEFYEIASIEYNEKFYALLQPVVPIEGMQEDEAVIFEFITDEATNERKFNPIFDEKLLEEVFSIYIRAVSDCECDCCECEHDCDDDCDCEKECDCKNDCDCKKEDNCVQK